MSHKLKVLVSWFYALFKLISPWFFRKEFITEDLLDINENPLKSPNKSGKGCFCTTGICKCTVVFKLKIYYLQMFSRTSDAVLYLQILSSSYSNSRGVFRIQSNIYDGAFCENSYRLSAVNYFHKKLDLNIRLGFEYASK